MKAIIFDVETTGKAPEDGHRVIELCITHWDTGESQTWRFNPERSIPPEATAIHGISMHDVCSCPKFGELAQEIHGIVDSAKVFIGYRVNFDIGFLRHEFDKVGLKISPGKYTVDPHKMWAIKEPRTLSRAYQIFVGDSLEDAHEAKADAEATGEVLIAMMERWGYSDEDWREIAILCDPDVENWIGETHHFVWRGREAAFGFGRHRGELVDSQRGYLKWMQEQNFPNSVQELVSKALAGELRR